MKPETRSPKPAWLQTLTAVSGIFLLAAVYLLAMRLTVDISRVSTPDAADTRDTVYLALHLGLLLVAAGAGFALGRWLSGLGLAYGTLFAVCLALTMVFAQMGSQALACEGHNDLIRHWECQ